MISYLCCTLPYLRALARSHSTLSTDERLVLICDPTKAAIRDPGIPFQLMEPLIGRCVHRGTFNKAMGDLT